jgi:hypothetical protein
MFVLTIPLRHYGLKVDREITKNRFSKILDGVKNLMKTNIAIISLFPILTIASMLFVSGCKTRPIEYTPSAQSITDKTQAKEIIKKMFLQQYRKTRNQQITINDDCINFAANNTDKDAITGRAYYYSNITNMVIYRERHDMFKVILFSGQVKLVMVHCLNEDAAKEFVNAIKYMQDSNTKAVSTKTAN